MTFSDIDKKAQTLFGQDTFAVNDTDYFALLALNNANATADLGGFFRYQANMGPGFTRQVTVTQTNVPVDSGIVEGG